MPYVLLPVTSKAEPAPLTEKRYVLPFLLIISLFFLWAFGVNLNDILIPHLKRVFGLTDFRSSFIQVAFFGGYFLAAFPAGWTMERIGYKKGILLGLLLCASGALLFLPASTYGVYGFFLFALFVMACGQSFLEVAANPYATALGPIGSAERRLNFAQSFNATGAVLSALLGRTFILTGVEYAPAQLAAMSSAQLAAFRASEASTVKGPYLAMAGIFVVLAVVFQFTHLPNVSETGTESESGSSQDISGSVLLHKHLVRGVLAQFFYVGAQVGVASFVIRLTQFSIPGTAAKLAAYCLLCHLIGFTAGRFIGSGLMKRVSAHGLLSLFAGAAFVCAAVVLLGSGVLPVGAVVLLGFFHSIMFPTIFALSIRDLGSLTKRGSSLLVMAIIGGAVFPAIMGRISDAAGIQRAFVVPLICYLYILYFGMSGYKPVPVSAARTLATENEGLVV